MKKRPPKKTSRSTYKIRRRKKYLGFSLIELLTVMAFLSILIVATIIMLKPSLVKAYDGQRKSDLKKIKNALEDYYNDYNCYPPADTLQNACLGEETALSAYIRKVPCDPQTKEAYLYVPFPNVSNTCGGYRVFAKLDNDQDKAIEDVHCDGEAGCGLGDGLETYNFGVSEGVPLACGDATPTPSPTPIAYALNFTSTLAGGVVSTANTSGLNFANGESITITAWVKPTDLLANRQEGIVAKGHDDLPKNFRLSLVSDTDGVGKLAFYYLDSNNPAIAHQYMASSNVVNNGVYFVALTYQYGNASSAKLYVNGNLVSGSWTRGTGDAAPAQVSESITIGGDTSANFNELFTGVIDEVKIYNTVLSAEQISTQYNSGLGVPSEAEIGLIAGWDFNEGSGSTVEDFSGNGHTGTLIDGAQTWVSGLISN